MNKRVFLALGLLSLATLVGLRFFCFDGTVGSESNISSHANNAPSKNRGGQHKSAPRPSHSSVSVRSGIGSSTEPAGYDIDATVNGNVVLLTQPQSAVQAHPSPVPRVVLPFGVQSSDVEVTEETGVVRVKRPLPGSAPPQQPPLVMMPPDGSGGNLEIPDKNGIVQLDRPNHSP